MNKIARVMGLAVIMLLGTAMPAFAGKGPCFDDVKKLCKNVKAGKGRVTACLDAHVDELSADCKVYRLKQGAVYAAWHSACKEDVTKFCSTVESGKGRIITCLAKHQGDLAPACRAQLDDAFERKMAEVGPCAVDAAKVCKAVEPGGGRLRKCLKDHKKEVGFACQEFLQHNPPVK